ncbi:hypothetical protein MSAN_00272700 [Mycena sanguinolenta]|uniref:Uncharacterized protein n=1 Tax=Mycena sanguinolenta TaxID=230812 RepID=A0A8H6ZL72_9AGAR|nr:hypothetical protein MSAN_00272700 [Mycena sanguinolenta]
MATPGSQGEGTQRCGSGSTVSSFKSLIDRSIAAWATINFVTDNYSTAFENYRSRICNLGSVEDVLKCRSYWFFQLRTSFLSQDRFLKFDLSRLDEYILLPIDYGWANNHDCYFISHYWRTASHPDPDGTDLRMFQQDLVSDTLWSFVWIDWTCAPQVGVDGKRTPLEEYYFELMLQCIPMLVRDCAFEWRFPAWEPRAWILYEVAEYILGHTKYVETEDNRPFRLHVEEMLPFWRALRAGQVQLELLVILAKIFPDDVAIRQELLDSLNKPANGTVSNSVPGVEISKTDGTVRYQGQVHRFTSTFNLTSRIALAFEDDEKQHGNGAESSEVEEERPDVWDSVAPSSYSLPL